MKTKFSILLMIITFTFVNGCSNYRYEENKSYDTDIIGTYGVIDKTDKDEKRIYNKRYILNEDNSYNYEGFFFDTSSISNGTYDYKKISNNLIEIKFNVKNITYEPNKKDYDAQNAAQTSLLIKCKNMLGNIFEAGDVPETETFNYILPTDECGGMVFTKDGYYHACMDTGNCKCNYSKDTKYKRKDDIIFFDNKDSDDDYYWHIGYYIIDYYLFSPLYYKFEE